jgi:8-oxo-dGTP diphosphatase
MPINNAPDIHEQVICANVFIRKDDKYLVLRRSPLKKYAPNVIHPVGGKVDIGENPFEAAVREVKEEAGIDVKNMRLEAVLQEIEPHKGEPYNWLIFHFSADYDKGDVAQTEEGELTWMTAEQIKGEELFPSVRLVVEHILDPTIGTMFATIHYDDEKRVIVKNTLDFCAAS